ncbi:hypothetical protein ANCCAN_04067 [Ancylostoma caninum]|uniref:Uncharacterized protein n=1 Tax=Ancylostoma caninum TaxID=29170 RepID=A0A368GZQ7_ANCCA|nr:hypothetical protein ANCCAN_04067 [Ancylostoma caninum]
MYAPQTSIKSRIHGELVQSQLLHWLGGHDPRPHLHIEEIPRLGRTRSRSESVSAPQCIEAKLYNKATRRLSAPCVSTAAASVSLRKKLQKMREERNSDSDSDILKEEDEEEIRAALAHRRASSGSAVYRI